MLKFIKNHTWVLTCFLAIVLIPQSLTLQSKLEGRLIITGLAIDKQNDEYLITAQAVSPSSGTISNGDAAGIDFISASAKTIREAITKIATTATKTPGLGHLNFVVIGESLFSEDITSVIDFIVRDSHTDTSVLMLAAKDAGAELKKTKSLELGSGIQLRKLFLSKQNMCNGTMTITNEFLSSKFEPSASCAISFLEIYSEPNGDFQGESEQSTASQSNQASSKETSASSEMPIKQGRVSFNSPVALFRDGRHKVNLQTEDEIVGYNLLCQNSDNFICGFGDLTENDSTKTKITLQSKKKSTNTIVKIENGTPIIWAKIKLSENQVLEQLPEKTKLENYKTQQSYLTNEMKEKIALQIEQKATLAFEKARQNNVDILKAATALYRNNRNQYNEYFKSHSLNDFLSEAKISISATIDSAIK